MQGATHKIGDQPRENQKNMEGNGKRAQSNPDKVFIVLHRESYSDQVKTDRNYHHD